MGTVDELFFQASKLPTADLSDLQLRLQALNSVTSNRWSGASSNASNTPKHSLEVRVGILYDALCTHLRHQLQLRPPPANKFFTGSGLGSQVRESLQDAVQQLATLEPELTRTEWVSVADLVAGLTVDYVKRNQFKVPWLGVAWALRNLPSLLDKHFPGYASSGLLKVVLRLRIQKRDQRIKKT